MHLGGFGAPAVGALVVAGGGGDRARRRALRLGRRASIQVARHRVAAARRRLRGGPLAERLVDLAANVQREPHADRCGLLVVDRERAHSTSASGLGVPALPLQVVGEAVVAKLIANGAPVAIEIAIASPDQPLAAGRSLPAALAPAMPASASPHTPRAPSSRPPSRAAHQRVVLARFRMAVALLEGEREAVMGVGEHQRVAGAAARFPSPASPA